MLDMAFQIMAFFVFTYNPAAVEGQFPISLAQGETAGDKEDKVDDKVATDQPTELKSTLFIEARAREKGRLGSLRVGTTVIEPDANEPDHTSGLIKALDKAMLELKKSNPSEDRITIKGTPTLRWDELMKVIDTARRHVDSKTKERIDLFPRISLGAMDQ